MVDYSVFNVFLTSSNWSMFHVLDKQRFHKALSLVVEDDDFSISDMTSYMEKYMEEYFAKGFNKMYSIEMVRNKLPSLASEAEIIEAYVKRDNW